MLRLPFQSGKTCNNLIKLSLNNNQLIRRAITIYMKFSSAKMVLRGPKQQFRRF